MDIEKAKIICNSTLDDFIKAVKELPLYEVYADSVKDGMKDSAIPLQAAASLHAMCDKEFSLMLTSVSHDLLFSIVDQKLRAEILSDKSE